ncbi:MAG: gamma-butyrobetaine hydroxylase-like domain-containing protein [Gammaproteobacteria bacterium]
MAERIPTDIKLHQKSRRLELAFDDGQTFDLSCEYLRVYSPSAEVRGHSPDQAVLQVGKEDVNITDIEVMGNYALKLTFDDGHDTGLYTWDYLYELGAQEAVYWQRYLEQLAAAGHERRA